MHRDARAHERPAPQGPETRLDVPPDPSAKRAALDRLVADVEAAGYSTASVFAVRLAAEEALTNAIAHGHAELPEEPVALAWRVTSQRIDVEVADRGPGFQPDAIDDPTLEEHLEKPAGRGLMLMRAYMTDVSFSESGNRVSMTYFKPPDPDAASG